MLHFSNRVSDFFMTQHAAIFLTGLAQTAYSLRAFSESAALNCAAVGIVNPLIPDADSPSDSCLWGWAGGQAPKKSAAFRILL